MDKQSLGRGLFVTVEGGEGVGKSTFVGGLEKLFAKKDRTILRTYEPGGTPLANRIRELFAHPPENEPLTAIAELLLVSASRAQHVQHMIKPHLARGDVVLCDRFTDSTRVYQGALGHIGRSTLEDIVSLATSGLEPDVTFLLDCDIEVSMDRLSGRACQSAERETRFDQARRGVHEQIRQAYLGLAKEFPKRIKVLDAALPAEEVLVLAWTHLEALGLA